MAVMVYIWLAVFVVSVVVEISAPALVSIWFAGGSILALILAAFLGDSLIWLQVLVFAAASVGCIFALRPILRRRQQETKTNVDSIIGQFGIVTEDISKYQNGLVKINGLVWTGVLEENNTEPIQKDSVVVIKDVKGNKLIVKKKEEV